ncbi:MAG: leucyl aminopeptidase family protein, partial [Candidatus Binatia bacterium]
MSVLPAVGAMTRVVAFIPATENMPSGAAIKPGDVLEFRNGKTAEVLNTDAEGRLVLADGLSLAAEAGADAIIGKGITFDSGGLSLKPAGSMETMKQDMAGAAAVFGTMAVIGRLRPDVEVTGYVPSTDNLPSGSAQKPGDVIRYRNGKTVEVLNTDAEGRLVLADALALACEEGNRIVIDLATLTGACRVALGGRVAGIMGNDNSLVESIVAHGREAGEAIWPLPLVKEYREELRSSVADLKNVGGSLGGAITAGLFLQEFVDAAKWAHLDIAGPAFAEKDWAYCPRGGTGFGIRTLVRYLMSL